MSELIKREDVQREIQASFDGGAFRWQDGQDLMDRINAIPAASSWHRVEDEMPKDGEWVLIWGDGFHVPIQAFHESGCWLDDQFEKYTATHWTPLPELSKEDAR